jgi:acyl-coenzyme A thioesterase PaaI-like protein
LWVPPIAAMSECFQDAMPGDVCFGCGAENPHGLRIRSFWEGDEGVCRFTPMAHHQGWPGITCGGILATLVDCHCMATAMASAVRREGRALDSEPHYRFATGSMSLRYLKPTPNDRPLLVRAHVTEVKDDRKYTLTCGVYSGGEKTVEATVVAFRVYRSDWPEEVGLGASAA